MIRIPAGMSFVLTLIFPACREGSPPPADSSAVPPPAAGAPSVMTAEAVRALGTEPFWALDIDSTGLRFTTPQDTSGMRFPPNVPSPIAGDTLVWMAESERAAIHVRIWPTQCSDGMSDRVYPWTATVRVGMESP